MRHRINIQGNDQVFPYIVEYINENKEYSVDTIKYFKEEEDNTIKLFNSNIEYYRDNNNWYSINTLNTDFCTNYIPKTVKLSNINIYIPSHSVSAYVKSIKYAVTLNTWINGIKIDLGTFIFRPTDTLANPNGVIKAGNNEYNEYISFSIIDPFCLIYSDEWDNFRKYECNESENTNDTCSSLYVSLFVIDEYENNYIGINDYSGGYTNFVLSEDNDYLRLNIKPILSPSLGFSFETYLNKSYRSLKEYLYETYNIQAKDNNIIFDLVIKDKNNIIVDTRAEHSLERSYAAKEKYGLITQNLLWKNISDENMIKLFFQDWNKFTEGWNIVGSLTIYETNGKDRTEKFSIVSNEIPITQELFSMFTNGGSEKIIDITDMNITTYNVVNKIENNIIQLERPNESKSNIIQPVFFRAKELEVLTLHPAVTENISINLDEYKSKVKTFILKIDNCIYNQIGANSYGIIFKITANTLPKNLVNGTYYILNENYELITTGKYNCIR